MISGIIHSTKESAPAALDKPRSVTDACKETTVDKEYHPLPEKKCNSCGITKPIDQFHVNRSTRDGLARMCKLCSCAHVREWRKRNPERAVATERASYRANQEKRLAYNRVYGAANADRIRAKQRARQQALKDAAYAVYGGYRCVCCGEDEPMFLCLDHVDGRGNEHRREIGGADRLYMWLKKNNYPAGLLQVLCFNCNQGKRLNGNVCPHQMSSG